MQSPTAELSDYMAKNGLSQAALAKQAHVSQATVSRALQRFPKKHSEAICRLCNYAGIELSNDKLSTGLGIKSVLTAFENIWDGSDAHAEAIARIIAASRGLRPGRT